MTNEEMKEKYPLNVWKLTFNDRGEPRMFMHVEYTIAGDEIIGTRTIERELTNIEWMQMGIGA